MKEILDEYVLSKINSDKEIIKNQEIEFVKILNEYANSRDYINDDEFLIAPILMDGYSFSDENMFIKNLSLKMKKLFVRI